MYRRFQIWMQIINNRFLSLYDYNFLLVNQRLWLKRTETEGDELKTEEKSRNPEFEEVFYYYLLLIFKFMDILSFPQSSSSYLQSSFLFSFSFLSKERKEEKEKKILKMMNWIPWAPNAFLFFQAFGPKRILHLIFNLMPLFSSSF